MRRLPSEPRADAMALVEAEGLAYAREHVHGQPDLPYWTEDAAYVLDLPELDELERVTAELHEMAMAATRHMAQDAEVLARLGLPAEVGPALRASLDDPDGWSLYGRFDLVPGEVPRLLEYNADTPAGLVEAAVTQWSWLEALHPEHDQWNLLHDLLVQAWQRHTEPGAVVHLAADEGEPVEDWNTVAYLADTVAAAGRHPVQMSVRALAFSPSTRAFVDATDEQDPRYVETIFKMYPWEWMLAEPLGRQVVTGGSPTRWLEPLHKVLTGSKALLPVLWQLYPDHPNLLPAYWDPAGMRDHVAKPVFGWEGAGIRITRGDEVTAAAPRHTAGQAEVYQQHVELPSYDGHLPVLGTWVVDGEPAGLGIRESSGPITDARARFLPHWLDAPRSTDEQVRQWLDPHPPPRGA